MTKLIKSFNPLFNSNITRLLHVPYFCNSLMIKKFIKLLFSCIHSVGIWMDKQIPIIVETIHSITGSLKDGQNFIDAFVVWPTIHTWSDEIHIDQQSPKGLSFQIISSSFIIGSRAMYTRSNLSKEKVGLSS
jgi:hypothetical protein